jgi:aspartyl-tRNA(Asn)/glutamyl-tRNA(Gln) amidotransferase subunit C
MTEKLINKKTVENLAELSRLDIKESEQEKIAKDLNSILNYIKELEKVPTQGINLDFVKKTDKEFRQDTINNEIIASNDELIAGFKEQKDKRLKIPPVFN